MTMRSWLGGARDSAGRRPCDLHRRIARRFTVMIRHVRQEFLDLVDGYETLEHYYLFADLYLERGDIINAQATLMAIDQSFDKSLRKDQQYQDHLTCYDVLIRLATESNTSLTQAEIDDLYEIADKRNNIVAGKARAILIDRDEYVYHEVIHFPDFGEKSLKRNREPILAIEETLNLFPNPPASIIAVFIIVINFSKFKF